MSQSSSEEFYYKTSDLALSSALCCYGYQIEAIDKENQFKAVFSIKKDGKLENLIQAYFTHRLTVEPLSFFNFLKELKTRIYHS